MGFWKSVTHAVNPVRQVKNVYNAVTGKDVRQEAAKANAAAEAAYQQQVKTVQTQSSQYDRKTRGDLGADVSALPGLGYDAQASNYTELSGLGLGASESDKKLSKRKVLGG